MIILGGLNFECETKNAPIIATYEHIKFGKGVHLTDRVSYINGTRMHRSEINLCKMKNRVVVIVGSKTESLHASDNTMVIGTSFRTDSGTDVDSKYIKSGLVVLYLFVLGNREKSDEIARDSILVTKIKGCKLNIFGSGKIKQHFNLDGGYYSYGNSSACRIINNSSVETYANKKSKM